MNIQTNNSQPPREPAKHVGLRRGSRARCRRSFVFGILATAVLLASTQGLEHFGFGQSFETFAFKWLTWSMSSFTGEALPVVVVDIHELPGGKDGATPRDELKTLMQDIAAAHPRAIAVDIDFSPDARGWMTPDDPDFFDYCLDVTERMGIPIILGVYRTRHAAPKPALGLPKYDKLAAIGIGRRDDPTRAVRWYGSPIAGVGTATIGEALAQANKGYAPSLAGHSPFLEPAAQRDDVLVNFSKLAEIKTQTIPWRRKTSIASASASLRNRLVILGDANEATDPFNIPTESDVVPGVFVIASTAYTLVREPLFEFRQVFRLTIDVAISLGLIGGLCYLCCTKTKEAAERLAFWYITAFILAVLMLGVVLVRLFSIMWLDFILIVLALFLHPRVEEKLSHWVHKRSKGKRHVHSGN